MKRTRRSELQIKMEILHYLGENSSAKMTHLMYAINISWTPTATYITSLRDHGLVQITGRDIRLTEAGHEMYLHISKILHGLGADIVSIPKPPMHLSETVRKCHLCFQFIDPDALFRVAGGRRTKYYHKICAAKVGFEVPAVDASVIPVMLSSSPTSSTQLAPIQQRRAQMSSLPSPL